jgi:hypothetical protein
MMKSGRASQQRSMLSSLASTLLVCCAYAQMGSGTEDSAPTKVRAMVSEPFASFELIDTRLTQIGKVLPRLTTEIPKPEKSRATPGARARADAPDRTKEFAELRSSVSSIQTATRKLQAHYRAQRQKYGVLMFGELLRKSDAMQNRLSLVSRAESSERVQSSLKGFSKALLPFVLQFQAVSGGYRALHCEAGSWSCCQPREVAISRTERFSGCRWVCAKRRARCQTGCLGPQLPPIGKRPKTIQPLSSINK